MIGVNLQDRFHGGEIPLAHCLQHLLHLRGGLVLIGNNAGGAVGQANRSADILYAVAQNAPDPVQQRLQFFTLVGRGFILQVLAG